MDGEMGEIDPKRLVERGYDQVAQVYGRLEGDAEWPRNHWMLARKRV